MVASSVTLPQHEHLKVTIEITVVTTGPWVAASVDVCCFQEYQKISGIEHVSFL